jgi:NAD(P)-dependent dehydrogenase (short-subunit alcohol dehydrogenase family)
MADAPRAPGSRLGGKVALVTGAGSGIGRATAVLFAVEGAAVACVDRDGDAARRTAAEIEGAGAGGAALAVEADVSSWPSLRSAADATVAAFGTIDAAVANAGIPLAGTAEQTELDDWERVIGVNLTGVWLTARAVLPVMRAAGGGAIVNIASASALVGMRAVAAYSAAKAGVVGLTRQMAADYGRDGIRVNALAPGITETPMADAVFRGVQGLSAGAERTVEDRVRAAAKAYPLGRLGRPDDIARAACFLASDDASWVTATVVPVDGGFTGM